MGSKIYFKLFCTISYHPCSLEFRPRCIAAQESAKSKNTANLEIFRQYGKKLDPATVVTVEEERNKWHLKLFNSKKVEKLQLIGRVFSSFVTTNFSGQTYQTAFM